MTRDLRNSSVSKLPGEAPPASRLRVRLVAAALVVCLVVILLATMWPTPLDRGFESSINRLLSVMHRNGIPRWFGYNKLEFSANVVMFTPLGFLIAMLLRQRIWWLAIIITPALSVGIELTQGALLSARFASPLDVLANSIGAIIGILLAVVIRALVYDRDRKIIARALWFAEQSRN